MPQKTWMAEIYAANYLHNVVLHNMDRVTALKSALEKFEEKTRRVTIREKKQLEIKPDTIIDVLTGETVSTGG